MTTSDCYGWVITWTHDDETPGTWGPRGCAFDPATIKAKGREFRMFDDDGVHYYSGFFLGPDDETLFRPLDDYGMPHAGCTSIQYRNARGIWEAL